MSASYVFFFSPSGGPMKECTLDIADSTPVREVMKTVGNHLGIPVAGLRCGGPLVLNSLWGDCNIPAGSRIRVQRGTPRNTEQPPSPPVMPSPVPTSSPATTIQTDIIPQEEIERYREIVGGDESLIKRLIEQCTLKPQEFRTPDIRVNWLLDNAQKEHSPKTEDTVQTAVQSPSSDDQRQQQATEEPVKTATISSLHDEGPSYEDMIRVRDALAKYPNKREILTLICNKMELRQERNSINREADSIASWYGLNPEDVKSAFQMDVYLGRQVRRGRKKAVPKA